MNIEGAPGVDVVCIGLTSSGQVTSCGNLPVWPEFRAHFPRRRHGIARLDTGASAFFDHPDGGAVGTYRGKEKDA